MMKKDKKTEELTVQSLREAAGLTQEGLARKLDCSVRIVGDWDNMRRLPRIDNAAILARELGVPLKTLLKAFKVDVSGIPDDEPLRR